MHLKCEAFITIQILNLLVNIHLILEKWLWNPKELTKCILESSSRIYQMKKMNWNLAS